MESKRPIIIVLSIVLGIGLIIAAIVLTKEPAVDQSLADTNLSVTNSELQQADGKDGRECLVAVDGTVYKIEGLALWQNGEHTPSEGQAHCGKDLSEAINESPHGKSKLEQLQKIGTLVD